MLKKGNVACDQYCCYRIFFLLARGVIFNITVQESLRKVLKVLFPFRHASAAVKKLSNVFSPRHFTVMERKESLLSLNLRLNTCIVNGR